MARIRLAAITLTGRQSPTLPAPQAAFQQAQLDMNLYWGELHLHTAESFDAALLGNRLSIEDAYRFATSHSLLPAVRLCSLVGPLIVAITIT